MLRNSSKNGWEIPRLEGEMESFRKFLACKNQVKKARDSQVASPKCAGSATVLSAHTSNPTLSHYSTLLN
jgi:hypothetical protein